MTRNVLGRAVLLAALCLPMAALAQLAQTSKWVNLRAGPAPEYPLVAQLPPATPLSVQGCVSDYSWCDVITPDQLRGWVYAGNLLYPYQYSEVPLLSYGPVIGLPIITFSIGSYWSHHYRDRPWYHEEPRWAHRPPHHRPPHARPPGERPPHVRPPFERPPGERPHGERPHGERPPHLQPPGVWPYPPGGRLPAERPPGARPPGEHRPGGHRPDMRPPGERPPGMRPPETQPSPQRPGRPQQGFAPGAEGPGRPPFERPRQPGVRPPEGHAPAAEPRARPGGPGGPERPNAGERREQR